MKLAVIGSRKISSVDMDIVRNKKINIRRGDLRSPAGEHSSPLHAFWDGKSKGTLSVIKYAKKTGKL